MPVASAAPATRRGHLTRWGLHFATLWLAGAGAGCGLQQGDLPLPHDSGTPRQIARGGALLGQYQCGSCHAIPGLAIARGSAGPSLASFGRRSYIAGHVPNAPQALTDWLVDPSRVVPETPMPAMGVSPADARDMAAYLLALR